MYQKLAKALRNMHRGQRGISGLETAIILIAFVTVASVLAYSVLSAGIFSAERGKETVYKGLEQAQSTLEIKGSVLGLSTDNLTLNQLQCTLALTIPNEQVDTNAIVVNYYDADEHSENVTATFTKSDQSAERGSASILEDDEQFIALVTIPATTSIGVYGEFTVQFIPPRGASLTINRVLPGSITPVMDLK